MSHDFPDGPDYNPEPIDDDPWDVPEAHPEPPEPMMRLHWHIGRSFVGHPLEDDCPCGKAPCGLVDTDLIDADCPQHSMGACQTIRQSHDASKCPAAATGTILSPSDAPTQE